ncbi:O-antigen ligase family protein [Agromyces bracchium]|uniref:O-antigen ligase domain-containing protein n=1 Tax=Agromyces bracchium TaxID=88376 RepID=A0A6I3M254_9MICO|nr:O-antigen ligase family protein [Agromyces bracchium]MTH66901.1 O-antigen ligase domain-containing protein [Agromyces bracchium]
MRADAPPVRFRERAADWWAALWRWSLLAIGTVVATYVLLDRAGEGALVTGIAIAALIVGVVVTTSKPLAIALMAMPALFVAQRAGFGGSDVSASDVALAAAFGTAVLLGHRPYSRELRAMLWFNLGYQFATLFTVIVNPFVQNTVEWFHAWLLISGALVVGWAIGRAGYARWAFTAMIAAGCVLAAGTIITGVLQYAGGNFGPVYPDIPWPMHKNFVGTALAFVALIAYVHPPWAGLSTRWTRPALWLLLIAIAMSQSRQAWIGLVVAAIVILVRRGGQSRLLLALAVPAIWLTVSMVLEQVESQNQHNSTFQRLEWFREVYAYWKHAPIFGHGLRFWYVDPTLPYQPPQAELEVAASAGLVGLAAFITMWIGFTVVLWRVDKAYGTLALAAVLSRIVQAQFDLFWAGVQTSVPFVIAGICLGAMALQRSSNPSDTDAAGLAPPTDPRGRSFTLPYDRAVGRSADGR